MRKIDCQLMELIEICIAHGFIRRGEAFFRCCGDGVIQNILYEKRIHPYATTDIKFGLYSVYGELEPRWMTSSGCIPRYHAHWLIPGIKERYYEVRSKTSQHMDDVTSVECYSLDLRFVECTIIPFLDQINTQAELSKAIIQLDKEARGPVVKDVLWNDLIKIAPYMHSKDYEMALFVVNNIIEQHEHAARQKMCFLRNGKTTEELLQEEGTCYFYGLRNMLLEQDERRIGQYLNSNHAKNQKLISFMRRL